MKTCFRSTEQRERGMIGGVGPEYEVWKSTTSDWVSSFPPFNTSFRSFSPCLDPQQRPGEKEKRLYNVRLLYTKGEESKKSRNERGSMDEKEERKGSTMIAQLYYEMRVGVAHAPM
jgi:hypothetical protein